MTVNSVNLLHYGSFGLPGQDWSGLCLDNVLLSGENEYCFAPDVHYHARLERDMARQGEFLPPPAEKLDLPGVQHGLASASLQEDAKRFSSFALKHSPACCGNMPSWCGQVSGGWSFMMQRER